MVRIYSVAPLHLWLIISRDILYELASVGDLPLPQNLPSNKRERDSDSPISATVSETANTPPLPDGPRTLAGSKRVNKDSISRSPLQQYHQTPALRRHQPLPTTAPTTEISETLMLDSTTHSSPASSSMTQSQRQQELYALPLYSNELGRIPLHGEVKFSTQAQTPPQPIPSSSSQPHPQHSHPHIPQHQAIDPGGFWYTFEQAQMRGLQSMGMGPEGPLVEQSSTSVPSSLGGPDTLSGPGGGGGSTSQSDADFIFGQLAAMGYPAPFSATLPHMLNGMGMGMLGTQELREQGMLQQQQRFGPSSPNPGVGPGVSGGMGGAGGSGEQEEHGFLDSDTLAMWSAAPTGFE